LHWPYFPPSKWRGRLLQLTGALFMTPQKTLLSALNVSGD
jgi:hypothetical protein